MTYRYFDKLYALFGPDIYNEDHAIIVCWKASDSVN